MSSKSKSDSGKAGDLAVTGGIDGGRLKFTTGAGSIKGTGSNETVSTKTRIRSLSNPAKARIQDNPFITKNYLREVGEITGRPVDSKQVKFLKEALEKQNFKKLPNSDYKIARKDFNKIRPKLLEEWEQNTGQKWPVYTDHPNQKRIGQPYDAHHVIRLELGGPNEWWNIYPAHGLTEHPKIHQGVEKEIIKGNHT